MNQQQLNKINEEFDDKFDRFTRIVCMSGDCDDIQNYEEVDYTAEVRDFLHSKLQEVIKDERERITEIALKVSSKIEDKGWIGADYCDGVHSACSNFIKEIKSLQTNKE